MPKMLPGTVKIKKKQNKTKQKLSFVSEGGVLGGEIEGKKTEI